MASDDLAFHVDSAEWPPSPRCHTPSTSTNHFGLSIPAYPTSYGRLIFHSDLPQPQFKPTLSDGEESQQPLDTASTSNPLEVFANQPDIYQPPTTTPFIAPSAYPFQAAPMSTDMQSIALKAQATDTISPLQTRLDMPDPPPPLIQESSGETIFSAASSLSNPWDSPSDPYKQRRSSSISMSHKSEGDTAPTKAASHSSRRHRRPSEHAEPGSARAIYLEKNRKAATKCRTKQKHQQEQLVETARTAERKNKALKVEVELLKDDMRDLMQLVGQHTECPDTRLYRYVQREADRLAMGDDGVKDEYDGDEAAAKRPV